MEKSAADPSINNRLNHFSKSLNVKSRGKTDPHICINAMDVNAN